MIDLHCHLLPGIDDGAKTMAMAVEMARVAVGEGIDYAVMTPHLHPGRYENTSSSSVDVLRDFRAELEKEQVALEIGMAAEVRLAIEILPLLDLDEVPFLGELDGYRIMLLEFPHTHIPHGAEKFVRSLLDKKIRPIIAHPERNRDVIRNLEKIEPFVEMNCLLQLTASAVAGKFGTKPQMRARQLLELGVVDVLATDAHNLTGGGRSFAKAWRPQPGSSAIGRRGQWSTLIRGEFSVSTVMRTPDLTRPLPLRTAALLTALVLAYATILAVRTLLADVYAEPAKEFLQSSRDSGVDLTGAEWRVVDSSLKRALWFEPDNPVTLTELGRLHRIRLEIDALDRTSVERHGASALDYYERAAYLRPTWPWGWSSMALVRYELYQDDSDAYQEALIRAAHFGPWQGSIQRLIVELGLDTWDSLRPGARTAVMVTVDRALRRQPAGLHAIVADAKSWRALCGAAGPDAIAPGADAAVVLDSLQGRCREFVRTGAGT